MGTSNRGQRSPLGASSVKSLRSAPKKRAELIAARGSQMYIVGLPTEPPSQHSALLLTQTSIAISQPPVACYWPWEIKTEEAAKRKSPRKRLRSSLPRGATRVSRRTSSPPSPIQRNLRPVLNKLFDLC